MSKSTADKKTLQYGPASLPAPGSKNFRTAVIGFLALDLAVIMTSLLVLEKMGSISLPGCGPQSACALAQNSAWGRVPLGSFELPVSFLGLGYFAGMLAAWLISRGRLPAILRGIAAFAGGVSVLYMGVIVSQGHYCPYCIVTHLANFAFVGAILKSPGTTMPALAPLATAVVIFLGVNAGALAVKGKSEAQQAQKQEKELEESVRKIADQSAKPNIPGDGNTQVQPATPDKSDKPWTGPFTGRYRHGPEKAAYRIVLYTDYQCPDCFKVEKDIVELMKTRSDISLSAKQFPFNKDCNPTMSQTLHGWACGMAMMAEAAGLINGNDGFWAMHHALFDRQAHSAPGTQGAFVQDGEFAQFVMAMGYPDVPAFQQVMRDPRITQWIKSDCEEAVALGLYYTPMVFINGVELKGVFAQNAVSRAIATLDARKPEPRGPEGDNPPMAAERHVSDWRESAVSRMPVDAMTFGKGPENARIRVAVIGDYQEAGTIEALRELSRLTAGRGDVRMDFRLYPFLRECNPNLPAPVPNQKDIPQFSMACVAARAAKAAGTMGGPDAFWKMHEWLIQNSADVSFESVERAAGAIGLDAALFRVTMDTPATKAAIATDAGMMRNLLFKSGIPTIRINDKIIPRWKLKGDNILERIFKELDKS